ncbi:dicarboxylate/amino acid:cation symporter [Lysobacter enzymogenes]|uniref:Transporter, dicarboxylate/amino acid:cation (Na+ or H+) symporter (DAACS) family n=1 Tax=Lysobacter enzymogenes TaxID=69 RepID=A0A0S2DE72_LYSEN|nr:dicarboxylate/amino acid:cation symporter [Lysobacter enzymogenes]ALN56801.1 transporter, dicarboxylate/amino acid:cation (Na+ or H+) symporter (DAACS) family [Lysobacter enzymogenes]QCW25546.1 dicarboxylate/amino acid:cation symporter [Lysobacter enzymogenes]QQP99933.1 dicarboxylate/amino acid:cation symporter [Lysobacter enzymogenes]UZW59378.1 dicarboxylate/amino acid:cation symporter [Lysobacter enzymogenes]
MTALFSAWFRIPFWQRVVAGFALGALAGWAMGPAAETWFGPLGDLYVTLIKMIAVPLVFFAVINAVASLHGQKSIAALGGRTFLWFAITAVLAVAVGLAVGTILQPGSGVIGLAASSDYKPRDVPSVTKVLLDVVPSNPFYALTGIGATKNAAGETVLAAGKGSILPVIFFAGLLGFAMVKLGEKVAGVRKLVGEASELMIQVTRFVLEVTPIGTFGLIAALVGAYGFEKLLPLGNFVLALYLACALHIVVVYSALLLAHGLNPLKFFRGAAPGMQVAFVSSSSFAAMPVAMRSIVHNLGVNKDYAAFASPLGASIKMDGCGAIYPALCAVFIAQYTGTPLTADQYFIVLIASVLGSFGTAGVPGTAVIMATVVLSAANLPLETIGYLYAIDRVLDMMRTMTNVTGQMLVPVLVAKETGLLDREVYEAASSNVGIEEEAKG